MSDGVLDTKKLWSSCRRSIGNHRSTIRKRNWSFISFIITRSCIMQERWSRNGWRRLRGCWLYVKNIRGKINMYSLWGIKKECCCNSTPWYKVNESYFSLRTPLNGVPSCLPSINCPFGPRFVQMLVLGLKTWLLWRTIPFLWPSPTGRFVAIILGLMPAPFRLLWRPVPRSSG